MKKHTSKKPSVKKVTEKLSCLDKAGSLYQLCRANRRMKAIEVIRSLDAMYPDILRNAVSTTANAEKKKNVYFFEFFRKNGKAVMRKGTLPYETVSSAYNDAISTGDFSKLDKIVDGIDRIGVMKDVEKKETRAGKCSGGKKACSCKCISK